MPTTLDRPSTASDETPVSLSPKNFVVIAAPPNANKPRRSFIERYQQHLWIAGLSILIIAVALSPLAMGYLGRQPVAAPVSVVATAPSNLSTAVTITASEFKFSPSSI